MPRALPATEGAKVAGPTSNADPPLAMLRHSPCCPPASAYVDESRLLRGNPTAIHRGVGA